MSQHVFHLPDLGEGLTEAELVEWRVAVGDTVALDQHVVVVETAKATVEVPCPYAGRVLALHGAAGDSVAVGSALITVGDESTSAAGPSAPDGGAGHEQYREEEQAGSGAVLVGYGTSSATGRRRHRTGLVAVERDPTTPPGSTEPVVPGRPTQPAQPAQPAQAVRVISPIVRRLAREKGVDLQTLQPQSPDGIIRRTDLEAGHVADIGAPDPRTQGSPAAVSARPDQSVGPAAGERRVPLTGLRGVMAERLTRSRRMVPDATTWVDTDATELLAMKAALAQANPDARIGVLALFARIALAGLRRFPELNASIDEGAREIVQHGAVHLGFAAQSPRGLVVPVVHDASQMTTTQLAGALRALTATSRQGRLSPAQLSGGTFTLNNYGVFGVDGSTPIVNYPEAAMLGVGRIVDRPWAHQGAVALRKVTQLGLTFDHRVCDGSVAGGFLRFVADCVESPSRLIADL